MKLASTLYFNEFPPGGIDCPAGDGRILRFATGPGCTVDIEYALSLLPAGDGEPAVDGVECRIWVADADGQRWAADSWFTTGYFMDELALASFENFRDLSVFEDAPPDIRELFASSLVVRGARYFSDDRFYRSLMFRGEVVQAIFKNSLLTFDIAVKMAEGSTPILYARLRQGVLYEQDTPLNDIRHTDELPSLIFELAAVPQRMLLAHGAVHVTGAGWITGPLPQPLRFWATGEHGAGQHGVRILERAV